MQFDRFVVSLAKFLFPLDGCCESFYLLCCRGYFLLRLERFSKFPKKKLPDASISASPPEL